ncbi:MAG: 30S ribosomal protein S2 [Elusimicrobia bacterium]|nr:30S ribosomal protein S2 [Elusimicrobiota bacterium]
MQTVSIKAMLEAGAHFGHQTRRWNPKMAKYIYGSRNNIHIVDLQKSAKELKRALRFVEETTARGSRILFVGTKRQAQETVKSEAMRAGEFYVVSRWVGGTLTNFATVRKSVEHLLEMEKMKQENILDIINKKEGRKFTRELESLKVKYEGIKDMRRLPDALFIVDTVEEITAVLEARQMKIPIVGICDTNADPDLADYPIPGNDDALRSIRFFTQSAAQVIADVKAKAKPVEQALFSAAEAAAGDGGDSRETAEEEPLPAPSVQA